MNLKTVHSVVLVVGVNGVGKTTTIGKLAAKLRAAEIKRFFMAAADTFRAAAGRSVERMGEPFPGVDMIGGAGGL